MINTVVIIGRLTQEPVIKEVGDNMKVTEVVLAVQKPFKNEKGDYDVDFIRCTLWQGLASTISEYCQKGSRVGIRGRLSTRLYKVSDEKQISVIELIAEQLVFLN